MRITEGHTLITGGASGLGLAVAEMVVQNEGSACILDLPSTEAEERVRSLGKNARFLKADITDAGEVQAAVRELQNSGKELRLLVNCAGIGTVGKTLQKEEPADLGLFSKTIQVNLIGTFNVCRLTAAAMAKNRPNEERERVVIINTASIAAFDGQLGQVAYAASKGGIVSMTLPMARDLAQSGIRVVTIAPGIFDTPLFAKLPDAAKQALAQMVPFPSRLGRPAEFALLVRQIAENPMLNGEVIRLDGALRMGMK